MTRDLTPFLGARADVVALDANHPDTALVALNARDPELHDVYRLNLRNGAIELVAENPGDVNGWLADHSLRLRVAQAALPDGGTEIRVRDRETSRWRPLLKWGPEDEGGVLEFSPDNRRLWVLSSANANAIRLTEVNLASGKTRVLSEDPQYDVSDVLLHPRTHALEATAVVRARTEWTALGGAVKADFDALRKVQEGEFQVVSRDLADRTWVVSYVRDDGPITWYTYDRATRQAEKLFANQPALESYRLARMQPISFVARDGLPLHGYLTVPMGVEPKKLPTILLVHGGPWSRDTWGFRPNVQHLVKRGYAVLQINFRGSAGYGKKHLNAGNREWGGKMHQDLLDGKAWAVQQGIADPQKVAIMGGSYGGYATLAGLAFTPDEFCCGVDIVGPSNLNTLRATTPPYWKTQLAQLDTRLGTGEAFLRERSPLHRADQIKAPLLIAQGANDPRVKQAESDQIVAAMRKNGKPVEYLVFPDEGHGFARPENRLKFSAATETFLAKYLGGRVEPASASEGIETLRR